MRVRRLVMGTQAATGGGAVVTVLTGTGGTISGELTSSDVNNMECRIHASTTETKVIFTWDEYPEPDEWTFEPGYLPVPGVLTNHLVLRHHRDGEFPATTTGTPWEPFNDHDIRFFVEKVTYWDADGNLCETNNTATAPADVSAWATFPTNPVTTDANGRVTELLTIVTNANLLSVTLVAYDWGVYIEAATPPPVLLSKLSPSGDRGSLKTLAAPEEPPVEPRTLRSPLINGDSAYKVEFYKAPEEDASGNQYGYDDMDTPLDRKDDHVSVDQNDGFTFVLVKVRSDDGVDGSAFTFKSVNPSIADIGPLPTPAPADGFLLKIIGKPLGEGINKLETIIEAHKGGADGPICGTIKVNVYRKKTTPDWIIYKVTDRFSPKTQPLFDIKGDDTKSLANKILKQAVMAVRDVKVEDRDNVPYDKNSNGCLEWYMDGDLAQPEFDIIKTAVGQHDDLHKSVVVKKVNFAWRLSDKAPKDQKKITLKGVGSNQALIEYFNLKIADFRWVELGTGGQWDLYKIDAIGAPKPDKTVDVWFETPLKQAYAAGADMISAGWGGGTTDANPTIVSGFQNAKQATSILVHEALHRPTIGDLRDVKDQKNVMSFGDSPTELRFKDQLWTSHNLTFPQNQWDKIPRP